MDGRFQSRGKIERTQGMGGPRTWEEVVRFGSSGPQCRGKVVEHRHGAPGADSRLWGEHQNRGGHRSLVAGPCESKCRGRLKGEHRHCRRQAHGS